jgi:hypothetical protein
MSRTPRRPSASAWLWDEIARRFGSEAAAALHKDYLVTMRAYNHAKWHTPESPWQPRAKPPKKHR